MKKVKNVWSKSCGDLQKFPRSKPLKTPNCPHSTSLYMLKIKLTTFSSLFQKILLNPLIYTYTIAIYLRNHVLLILNLLITPHPLLTVASKSIESSKLGCISCIFSVFLSFWSITQNLHLYTHTKAISHLNIHFCTLHKPQTLPPPLTLLQTL